MTVGMATHVPPAAATVSYTQTLTDLGDRLAWLNGLVEEIQTQASAKGPALERGGRVDGPVLALGTFNGHADVGQFQMEKERLGGLDALMVTDEKAPGVPQTKNAAVVIGTV